MEQRLALAARISGRDPEKVHALALVSDSPNAVAEARRIFPNVEHVLAFNLVTGRDVYREIAELVLERDVRLRDIVGVCELSIADASPSARALADILRGFSANFASRELSTPEARERSGAFIERWTGSLRAQGNDYHALRLLWPYVRDVRWTVRIAEAAVACNCPEAAQFALRAVAEPDHPEVEARIAQRQQNANALRAQTLQALEPGHPSLARTIREARSLEHIWLARVPDVAAIFPGGDANAVLKDYALLIENSDGGLLELNAPPDPLPIEEAYREAPGVHAADVLVGSIVRYTAALFARGREIKDGPPNWQQCLYFLETNPRAFATLAGLIDVAGLLDDRRATVFVGEDAEQQFVDFLRKNPNRRLPHIFAAASVAAQRAILGLHDERSALIVRAAERLAHGAYSAAPSKARERWTTRSEPLRVLIPTSIHTAVVQYVARDLRAGFEEAGHEARIIVEASPNETLHPLTVARIIDEFRPDLIFVIDHIRPENVIYPADLPYACWIQDELSALGDPGKIAALGARDFTYAYSDVVRDKARSLGYPHVETLSFAVNTDLYRPDPEADDAAEASVAFITNISDLTHPSWLTAFHRWMQDEVAKDTFIPVDGPELDVLVTEAVRAGVPIPHETPQARSASFRQCILAARQVLILRHADFMLDHTVPMALYGAGWDKVPRFHPFARGPVAEGEALRRTYQRHRVVLHVGHHLKMHPRVLEATASGTCVLVNGTDVDVREDAFPLRSELPVYRTMAEFLDLARRALRDHAYRTSVVSAARAKIVREHRYVNRARQVVEDIAPRL